MCFVNVFSVQYILKWIWEKNFSYKIEDLKSTMKTVIFRIPQGTKGETEKYETKWWINEVRKDRKKN